MTMHIDTKGEVGIINVNKHYNHKKIINYCNGNEESTLVQNVWTKRPLFIFHKTRSNACT